MHFFPRKNGTLTVQRKYTAHRVSVMSSYRAVNVKKCRVVWDYVGLCENIWYGNAMHIQYKVIVGRMQALEQYKSQHNMPNSQFKHV